MAQLASLPRFKDMNIDQALVDRTTALLADVERLLDQCPPISGELRVKLSKAELCLFKLASLMQEEVDSNQAGLYNTTLS